MTTESLFDLQEFTDKTKATKRPRTKRKGECCAIWDEVPQEKRTPLLRRIHLQAHSNVPITEARLIDESDDTAFDVAMACSWAQDRKWIYQPDEISNEGRWWVGAL